MRPIKLTMQAFGPYAECESVDFREALASGLFGIYGATGAGKSTIFSAISFALFGEAARNEQDTSTLRSDRAAADRATEVELIFEIGSKRYYIRRRPEQTRPKQRGTGETRDQHEAWLFDATGIDVEKISATNCGASIAEKKVGVVREAVIDALGYGPEQFKQIVLLPQGKFETFLTAKTDERLKILRELFDVALYKRLASKMKDDAKAAEDAVVRDREVCVRLLQQEGCDGPNALTISIDNAKASLGELTEQATSAQAAASIAERQLNQATHLDTRFIEHEQARTALTKLEHQATAISVLSAKIQKAKLAQTLLDPDSTLTQCIEQTRVANGKMESADKASQSAAKKATAAAATLACEKLRAGETNALRQKQIDLARHKETLEATKALTTKVAEANGGVVRAKAALDAADKQHKTLQAKHAADTASLKAGRSGAESRARLMAENDLATRNQQSAEDYEKAVKALAQATEADRQAVAALSAAKAARETAQAEFVAAETALADAQALHLAAKLVDGEACPVCGSPDHPAPAEGALEGSGLDQAFRQTKKAVDGARDAETVATARLSAADATKRERESNLNGLVKPENAAVHYKKQLTDLTAQISALGVPTDIAALESKLEELGQKVEVARAQHEQKRTEWDQARTQAALAAQELESALKNVPADLQLPATLESAIAETAQVLRAHQDAFQSAEKEERETREAALSASKDLEAAQNSYETCSGREKVARDIFSARLSAAKLTQEAFQQHKLDISQIDSDTARIEKYRTDLAVAEDRVVTSGEALKDIERPDLVTLQQANATAASARDTANSALAVAQAEVKRLETLFGTIALEFERISKMERDTITLRSLAQLFNAGNQMRLELETFAIGAMFDEVLRAANVRLKPMSSGRYSLEREVEGGKGAAKRGLGICVHDVETGKTRATQTLSGGETFIAALALALGLSDIVESVSGGIRLDTIFIDEGFGSLDSENDSGTLDQVLQTLTDLVGQNRAVGLISHVKLVQETIPNGFWIEKTAGGSHIQTRSLS